MSPPAIVALTTFMRGPFLSEAAVVDLEALQRLHLACGPTFTPVPYWDELQAGCRPGALPSTASLDSPGEPVMDHGQGLLRHLSPSKVHPSLPLRSRGPGPFPTGLGLAGGSRFAKRLSLAKRPKFLGTETETAAQTVPLPGKSRWSHHKLRETTAPS